MSAQLDRRIDFEIVRGSRREIDAVEIEIENAPTARIERDPASGAFVSRCDTSEGPLEVVTRSRSMSESDLIVRLLKNPVADRLYLRAVAAAREAA
jgi:hypothetical protein